MSPLNRCLTHLVILSIRTIGSLPAVLRYGTGCILGTLAYILSRRHRHIGRTNASLCFPTMNKSSREFFVYRNFCQLSIGVCETAYAWCGNIGAIVPKVQWEEREEFEKVCGRGKPIMLISGHFSCLDPGLIVFAHSFPLVATYKMHRNRLFNDFGVQRRLRYVQQLLSSQQTLAIKQAFHQQRILWFSIDQDIGRKHSLFAPFFGVQAACHTVAWRWSRIVNAEVFLLHCIRTKNLNYKLSLFHLKDFSKLPVQEAITHQNEVLSQAIRQAPTQYLWLHKRFKTHADGKNVYA